MVLVRTKYQRSFGVDPMSYGHFGQDQIRPDIKYLLAYTQCLMDILDRTKWSCKYQECFGMDQISYGHFDKNQMILKISRTFWRGPNLLWKFWTGPNFKDILGWIKCLMYVLDITRCLLIWLSSLDVSIFPSLSSEMAMILGLLFFVRPLCLTLWMGKCLHWEGSKTQW